eukprot:COSAG01_NODE_6707_length_3533_cov_8.328289_3_plen_156_part_00
MEAVITALRAHPRSAAVQVHGSASLANLLLSSEWHTSSIHTHANHYAGAGGNHGAAQWWKGTGKLSQFAITHNPVVSIAPAYMGHAKLSQAFECGVAGIHIIHRTLTHTHTYTHIHTHTHTHREREREREREGGREGGKEGGREGQRGREGTAGR